MIHQTPKEMLLPLILCIMLIIGMYVNYYYYNLLPLSICKYSIVASSVCIFAMFDYLLHSRVLQEVKHRLNLPEVDPEMNYAYRITQVLFQVMISLLLFVYFGYVEALLFNVFWLGGIADGLYYVYENTNQYFKLESTEKMTWTGWTYLGWFAPVDELTQKRYLLPKQFVYQIWVTGVLGTIIYFLVELV